MPNKHKSDVFKASHITSSRPESGIFLFHCLISAALFLQSSGTSILTTAGINMRNFKDKHREKKPIMTYIIDEELKAMIAFQRIHSRRAVA